MFKRYFSDPLAGMNDIAILNPETTSVIDVYNGVYVMPMSDLKSEVRYVLTSSDSVTPATSVLSSQIVSKADILPSRFRSFIDEESIALPDLEVGRNYVMKETIEKLTKSEDGTVNVLSMQLSKVTVTKINKTKTGKCQVTVTKPYEDGPLTFSEMAGTGGFYSKGLTKSKATIFRSFTYI